jgi:uncharacterized protein YecE (DUF72 family)
MSNKIFFGIAGFSYSDWEGIVYPEKTKDKLHYIAEYIDVMEINSSFYHLPSAKTTASWLKRSSHVPGFLFTAKLHQDITHSYKPEPSIINKLSEGFKPLAEAGKLQHLLAQFKYDFADSDTNRTYLKKIYASFADTAPIVFELRHNSWQSPDALEFLDSMPVTVANLDYPYTRDSFNLRMCTIGAQRYLRLHGRNRKNWFDHNAGRDQTYDYLYSGNELKGIAERAKKLTESAQSLTIVTNNHFKGQAVANILQLKSIITEKKVNVPPMLLYSYPQLSKISIN